MWHKPYRGVEFMQNNFLVSWDALNDGRYWTLLTSVFSHIDFWHIFMNMFVLYNFGFAIESILGSKQFTVFYIGSGIFSSFCHGATSNYFLHNPSLPALGASGAVSAVILLFSFLFPREKILLLGIIPLPAIFGALAFVALDVWGLMAQSSGGGLPIGHGAHLGGALAGAIYYFFYLRPKLKNRTNIVA